MSQQYGELWIRQQESGGQQEDLITPAAAATRKERIILGMLFFPQGHVRVLETLQTTVFFRVDLMN